MKVGQTRKFSFGTYLIEKEIQTEDFQYIENNTIYNIIKLLILKNRRLPTVYIGISDKGWILKLPNDKIKQIINL